MTLGLPTSSIYFRRPGVKKFGHLFNRKKNEANNLRRQVLVLSIAKWNPRYISEFLDSEHMARLRGTPVTDDASGVPDPAFSGFG